jgi:DNA excision repair protein ERCC-5
MGVTGLWTVVHPCARPVKIETLNKKRLAVDASIWIYQFLKAVRDKEGNQLRNSHIVGFFRRICKLLFVGIKPVFVFDGGAPALKRQTISGRKRRREGRREDAVRTAGKLLAVQMQRLAEEEDKKRHDPPAQQDVVEEAIPENPVYVDELQMTQQERQQSRRFKKQDAYHLPDLQNSMSEMGQPNDPRIMSLEELQHYANQFNSGEDINVYDFSKIDFDSSFFQSLPASDRYNILNAARLRSRLRMGYSKDQLDRMFPDRMAFSKFQIERVTERNELTQRLMNLNGMNEEGVLSLNRTSRVAGEKGREYVLVKNDGVEGGWALGVVSTSDEGQKDKPIRVDDYDQPFQGEESEDEDEDEFEDVPIEGLNRLPTAQPRRVVAGGLAAQVTSNAAQRRKAVYQSRQQSSASGTVGVPRADEDSLFVSNDSDGEWENGDMMPESAFYDNPTIAASDDDADLQRAIAMSLEQENGEHHMSGDDAFRDDFQPQTKAAEPPPFYRGNGKAIAHIANSRANKAIANEPTEASDDDENLEFQTALAESRKSMHKKPFEPGSSSRSITQAKPSEPRTFLGFDGPLPFEKLDLGSSILGKKKSTIAEHSGGGFQKKEPTKPLPPWFAGGSSTTQPISKPFEVRDPKEVHESSVDLIFESQSSIRDHDSQEIIDLDAPGQTTCEIITILSDGEDEKERQDDTEKEIEPEESIVPADASLPKVDTTPTIGPVITSSQEIAAHQPDEDEDEWETIHIDEQATRQSNSSAVLDQISSAPKNGTLYSPRVDETMQETSETPLVDDDLPADAALPADVEEVDMQEADEFDAYSDPEDEELFRQLAQEDEEHARFTSSLNNRPISGGTVDFDQELKQLRNQQKKDRRDADEVTQTMITECQQLLSLFGLPYITAPMEAEAQCAELVRLGLVDGIVTDDSDVFLFGGTRVYKNMFNQAKLVECYLSPDLEAEFGLNRERLISIAQLLGSDYTEGLPGVGPVTALEILSEFDDLAAFRDWWTAVQTGTQRGDNDMPSSFRKKFRKNITKVFLPPVFPDVRVDEAYLHPEVDSDPSQFVWGVPDLDALRSFLMSTIGWSPERTDEVLVPVIRDMNRRETEGTQSNITAYFGGSTGAGAFAPRVRAEGSKRLESALQRIGQRGRGKPDRTASAVQSEKTQATRVGKRRKAATRPQSGQDSDDMQVDAEYVDAPRRKERRKTTKTG